MYYEVIIDTEYEDNGLLAAAEAARYMENTFSGMTLADVTSHGGGRVGFDVDLPVEPLPGEKIVSVERIPIE